jgi:hypothetical protein
MRKKSVLIAVVAALVMAGLSVLVVSGSSHREAPLIAQDQYADDTDVYAFISPNNPDNVVLVGNWVPLLLPASGPNFYKFSDDVLYEIRVDNNGDAIPDVFYQFDFETTIQNGKTFLYNTGEVESLDDENLNVRQTYTLTRVQERPGPAKRTVLGENIPVAPWHVGDRSFADYDSVANQAVTLLDDGVKVFAGPRDEPFFVDLHIFDLLGVGGTPTTDGLNVMSIVLEVPITDVAKNGNRPAADEDGPTSVIGVYATASRQKQNILRENNDPQIRGKWIQVSRLGWPLVNEVVNPLEDKDKYNRTDPVDDVANFGENILFPEVPGLLSAILGLPCAETPDGGRTDIVGLLSPNSTTPADLLRLNITEGQTIANVAFPNGRKLDDDVTDTLLTVLCNSGSPVGDGVDANDLDFSPDFPYLASPHTGNPSIIQTPGATATGIGVGLIASGLVLGSVFTIHRRRHPRVN